MFGKILPLSDAFLFQVIRTKILVSLLVEIHKAKYDGNFIFETSILGMLGSGTVKL